MIKRALFKSSFREKVLFLEAFFLSIYFKLYLFLVPSRTWAKKFKKKPSEILFNENQIKELKIIKKSVQRAGKLLHFKNQCLVLCLTSNTMLKKRGYQAELHLGLDKKTDESFLAHAWLTIGNFSFISDNQTQAKLF